MIQKEDRLCQDHKLKVVCYCLYKNCDGKRLVCTGCLAQGSHTSHLKEFVDVNLFNEKVNQLEQDSQKFIMKLNNLVSDTISQVDLLKKGIQEKYGLSVQHLERLSNDQLTQYICEFAQFKEQEINIFEKMKHGCKILFDITQQCLQELQLDSLSYSVILQADVDIQIQSSINQIKNHKDYEKSIMELDEKINLNPNDANLYQRKGDSLRLLAKYEESLDAYDKALQIDPKLILAFDGKGHSLRMVGNYKESIQYHEKALELNPKNLLSCFGKADSLRMLSQYHESIIWYEKALQIDPKHKFSLDGKGHALRMMGKYQESLEFIEKALQIDPNYQLSVFGKGDCLRMLKKYKESLEWYDKAQSMAPKHKQSFYGKGASLYMLQENEKALDQVEQALKISPNDYLSLSVKGGACLIALKKYEEAKQPLLKALEINPNYDFAKQQFKKYQTR